MCDRASKFIAICADCGCEFTCREWYPVRQKDRARLCPRCASGYVECFLCGDLVEYDDMSDDGMGDVCIKCDGGG